MVNELEAVSNISGSVAGEQSLLEAGISSGSLRRHYADQIANGGDDVRRKRTQNMTIAQITFRRKTGDDKFCFCIVEPSNGVLFPKGSEDKAVRRGGRRVAGVKRLRQGLYRGGSGGGRLRGSRLIHLHHCIA
jgi:hypothetical protein